jgi:predicted ArsR family transcriptional regulator
MKTDTSREAHKAVKPKTFTLREQAMETLRLHGPLTADAVAKLAGVSPFAMRPRLTELRHLGLIEDTGLRRRNDNGKSAAVWRLVRKLVTLEQGALMLPVGDRS